MPQGKEWSFSCYTGWKAGHRRNGRDFKEEMFGRMTLAQSVLRETGKVSFSFIFWLLKSAITSSDIHLRDLSESYI